MFYATFWQRFAAGWIDFFILLPLILITVWLESLSKTAAIIFVIPINAAYVAYSIYFHGRCGQTIGKHVMGIRVVKTNGEKITWQEAWLRSSVDSLFAVFAIISAFVALTTISDADYYSVDWTQRTQNLLAHEPAWLSWASTAAQVWVWSEVIVILFNRKRRALHDFIAGTVVIDE